MEKGFSEVSGRLDLIAANQDRTAKDVEELDARVAALEARRVPWQLMSAVTTVGGGLGAVIGVLVK